MTCNLAFIGVGFVAQQVHLPCFASNPNFTITHVAEPIRDLREQVARKYNIKYQFDDHFQLLSHGGFDAVVVTLPRLLSYPVVRDCAKKHGLYILAEKPICLNYDYASELISICESCSSFVMTGYMRQHDTAYMALKSTIDSIDRSSIVSVVARLHGGYSYCNPLADYKGSFLPLYKPEIQQYPAFLDDKQIPSFEQFLNLFSHITHLVDNLLSSELTISANLLSQSGEGILACRAGKLPIVFDLIYGKQYHWFENISVSTRTHHYHLELNPAFLRNQPGRLTITSGSDASSTYQLPLRWEWAFMNQTIAFYQFIKSDPSHDDLMRALRQVKLAQDVFQDL